LVACPNNTLVDSKDYFAPIITPMELEVALGDETWDIGKGYSTDFAELLIQSKNEDNINNKTKIMNEEERIPRFSLSSGGRLIAKPESFSQIQERLALQNGNKEEGRLVKGGPKHLTLAYESAAAMVHKKREFQGLDP